MQNNKDSSQIECSVWFLHQRAISIYIHRSTKTLLFQKYISYICITVEKRLNQGGHISSVIPLWPLLSVFYIYVFSDVDKKKDKRREGIIIYMTYVFKKSNVFVNGCIYIYMYLYHFTKIWNVESRNPKQLVYIASDRSVGRAEDCSGPSRSLV